MRLFSLLLLGSYFLGESAAPAQRMQIVKMPPVGPISQKIAIDGQLDEWKGVEGWTIAPLGGAEMTALVRAGGNPALSSLLQDPPSATVQACYDPEALYLAVSWKDAQAGLGKGESLELHLVTDRACHVALRPTPSGDRIEATIRYDDAPQEAAAGAIQVAGKRMGGEFTEEVRIPWATITRSGSIPAEGKVGLGADFAWNAIGADALASLAKAATTAQLPLRGATFCFLSSHPPPPGAGGLPDAADWGDLLIGGNMAGRSTADPEGTGISKMAAPWTKTPPDIDGSLKDWDPARFEKAAYLPAFFGSRYECRIAAQADAENLYLAAHFASPGKASNVMREATQAGYAGGDALQIRLSDGKRKISLCGWFDGAAGRPALTADGKDLQDGFLLRQGAREAFRQDDDGRGYVQELAIPWRLLFPAPPEAGQRIKATFQPWWSDLTPRFPAVGQAVLERQGGMSLDYKLPRDGQVTLGLFTQAGRLLRWIACDEFRTAGDNGKAWDGLDQWGQPVPAGDYLIKGIYHPPITAAYALTVGNPGTPPWPTPDDRGDWLSDEATPQAAATDGEWVFLGAPGAEKGFTVIALDKTGQRQWGLTELFNPRSIALAVDGDRLYALYSGPEIMDGNFMYTGKNAVGRAILVCLDKRTGRPAGFTKTSPQLQVATWPHREEISWLWDLRRNHGFTPFVYGGQPRYSSHDIGESTNALGVAAAGGRVYVSLAYENRILVVDAETGKPTGDQIDLASPAGLCAAGGTALLAVSGKKVVRIDLASKGVTPVIVDHLEAPDSLARDGAGNIYVSDWGASFQVKKFDGNGRFLQAVGKEGGRPWVGKWDPSGMLVPRGIAVTQAGELWVAEDDGSPARISVWNAASGSLARDYIGPTPYGGGTGFWIDPADPAIVHAEGTCFRVDYDRKTAVPLAIDYRREGQDAPFTPNGHSCGGYQVRTLFHDGREYAVFNKEWRTLSVLQRNGDVYKPVAALGTCPRDPRPALTPDSDAIFLWDSDVKYHVYPHYNPSWFAGHVGDNFSWTDANGDNLAQSGEMHWVKGAGNLPYREGAQGSWMGNWNLDIAPDWTAFFPMRFQDRVAIFKLGIRGWTPAGAPLYDMADAKPFAFLPANREFNALHATEDGHLVVSYNFESNHENDPDAIECFDMQGRSLWAVAMPKILEGKRLHANCIGYDFLSPGLGDVVCAWNYHGSYKPYFFTTDGLYLGSALDDTLLGPTATWSESAKYFHKDRDGNVLLVNGANQQEHLLRLSGLNEGGRFEAPYSISAEDVSRAAAMRRLPETTAAPQPALQIRWLTGGSKSFVDQIDSAWSSGATLDGGNGRSANVVLMRDEGNLYLGFQVREPTPPLVNHGENWQSLFITGDCVDLMFSPATRADHREAAPGDKRLLLGVFQDKPIAVLYEPATSGAEPSPVRLAAARIDRVTRLDDAAIQVVRNAEEGSYRLFAAIPLKSLGLDAVPGPSIRGDVGVIYADDSGRNRVLRLYYYNRKTGMTADLTTEATLQPAEWGNISFPIRPNLLRNGGFEEGLAESDSDRGWTVSALQNGGAVDLVDDHVRGGRRSLRLKASLPVAFPDDAYSWADYTAFLQAANGGKGGEYAEVRQTIPVIAGHQYSLSYHFCSEGLQKERRAAGKPRGYAGFSARIEWHGAPPFKSSTVGAGSFQESKPDWTDIRDYSHGWDLPHPYLAPEGASSATIVFGLTTKAADAMPSVYLDDVEWNDATPDAPTPP